jgi:hypothetical protein
MDLGILLSTSSYPGASSASTATKTWSNGGNPRAVKLHYFTQNCFSYVTAQGDTQFIFS